MAYASPMKIANGLVLDFTVDNADTAADTFLGLNASGEVTQFASVPRARVSGGGNITEATSSVLTITGGTAAVLTSGLTIQVKLAGAAQSGYLSTTDWNTFNNKLGTSLTSGYIYVGNGSNVATGVAVSGDITISNAGVVAIASGVIVNADINASAAIAVSKLAAVTASRVLGSDGSGFIQALDTATYPSLTELAYVKGVTSAIQTQLNNRLSVTLSSPTNGDVITYNGSAWVNSPSSTGVPTAGTTAQILRKIDNTNYNTEWHTLVAADITDVSSTAAELNKLSGVTTTATQFNFLNTLSGDVQAQLAAKLSTSLTQNYMIVGDASNIAVPLAPGTNGYVLTSVSGVPTWVSPGSGGTVTSVAASGGTTGMSFTGSPITTSGTLTLTGTLAVANGGTGLTSLGTAYQMLRVNSGATALEYFSAFLDNTLLMRNVANTFSSQFTNTNTAARTYTLPNFSGNILTTTGTNTFTGTTIFDGGSAANWYIENFNNVTFSSGGASFEFDAGGGIDPFFNLQVNGTSASSNISADYLTIGNSGNQIVYDPTSISIDATGTGVLGVSGKIFAYGNNTGGTSTIAPIRLQFSTPSAPVSGDFWFENTIRYFSGGVTNVLVEESYPQTLTNKTISPTSNTIRYPTRTQSGTSYTIQASDENYIIQFTSASAIAVTLPDGLSTNFNCTLMNYGGGVITVTAATTLNTAGSANTIETQYTGASFQHVGSNVWDGVGALGSAGGGSGDVVGPASSTNNNVVFFDGTTGKLIKDSGLTLSGTNTGDQTTITGNAGTATTLQTARTIGIATGDVTSAGSSFNGSANNTNAYTIANDAVTYAKMQNVSAASKLIGRGDSGSGDPQEITIGSGLTMTGTTLSASGGGGIGGSTGGTDNSVLRADGTGGATLQNSAVFIGDTGNIDIGTDSGTIRNIQAAGSGTNVGIQLLSKGTGVVAFSTTNTTLNVNGTTSGLAFSNQSSSTFYGSNGTTGNSGWDLIIRGGNAYSGDGTPLNGGHLYLNYGAKNTTGLDGNIGLLTNSVADWQDMERGVYLANRLTAPTAGIANGVALFAEDVNSSSEFFVYTESGAKVNISGLLEPVTESGTSFTLNETHRNKIVLCSNSGAITVTVNTGKVAGWNCMLVATHATGTISLSASSTTINGTTATTAQFETLSIVHYGSENYLSKLG